MANSAARKPIELSMTASPSAGPEPSLFAYYLTDDGLLNGRIWSPAYGWVPGSSPDTRAFVRSSPEFTESMDIAAHQNAVYLFYRAANSDLRVHSFKPGGGDDRVNTNGNKLVSGPNCLDFDQNGLGVHVFYYFEERDGTKSLGCSYQLTIAGTTTWKYHVIENAGNISLGDGHLHPTAVVYNGNIFVTYQKLFPEKRSTSFTMAWGSGDDWKFLTDPLDPRWAHANVAAASFGGQIHLAYPTPQGLFMGQIEPKKGQSGIYVINSYYASMSLRRSSISTWQNHFHCISYYLGDGPAPPKMGYLFDKYYDSTDPDTWKKSPEQFLAGGSGAKTNGPLMAQFPPASAVLTSSSNNITYHAIYIDITNKLQHVMYDTIKDKWTCEPWS